MTAHREVQHRVGQDKSEDLRGDSSVDPGRIPDVYPTISTPAPRPRGLGASVYFIQCNGPDGPIKIGQAKFIDKRLCELQIGCPYELALIGHALVDDASLVEGRLHDAFREHRIRGEWFCCHARILNVAREFDAVRFAAIAEMAKAFVPSVFAGPVTPVTPEPATPQADDWLTTFRAHRTKQRASGNDPARRRR